MIPSIVHVKYIPGPSYEVQLCQVALVLDAVSKIPMYVHAVGISVVEHPVTGRSKRMALI